MDPIHNTHTNEHVHGMGDIVPMHGTGDISSTHNIVAGGCVHHNAGIEIMPGRGWHWHSDHIVITDPSYIHHNHGEQSILPGGCVKIHPTQPGEHENSSHMTHHPDKSHDRPFPTNYDGEKIIPPVRRPNAPHDDHHNYTPFPHDFSYEQPMSFASMSSGML
jgi:hypothetical protein